MTPWHFTPQPTNLPIEQFRERYFHPDMPEKMEMIHGRLFWSEAERLHVLGMLIESLGTAAVEQFMADHANTSANSPPTTAAALQLTSPGSSSPPCIDAAKRNP